MIHPDGRVLAAPAPGALAEATAAPYDVDALRAAEFPWAARGDAIYLNNASTGPLPASSVAAQEEWLRRRAEPFRLVDAELHGILAAARAAVARLVGAGVDEIALMPNTSYGLNVAATALPLGPGDVIVVSDREFPANVWPWIAQQGRGARCELAPTTPEGWPDEAALLAALDRPEVKVLSVSWVQFATGYRLDLDRLGAACRARGKWFVVDAIQGLGPLTLDLARTPVDLLACGAQKWLLGPWGSGFLYVRRELLPRLVPSAVGWLAVQGSDDFTRLTTYDPAQWPGALWPDARRFEVRTLPHQDFAGMVASLALYERLGPAAVAAHVQALADRIVRWCAGRDDVRLATPADPARRAGIVGVVPRDAAAASARLRAAGVTHSVREGAIRLSPHGYNSAAEVDRALAALAG